jgi:hypothetical protein
MSATKTRTQSKTPKRNRTPKTRIKGEWCEGIGVIILASENKGHPNLYELDNKEFPVASDVGDGDAVWLNPATGRWERNVRKAA